jgi:hypothetical protein
MAPVHQSSYEGLGGSPNLANGGSRGFDGFDAKVTLEELV